MFAKLRSSNFIDALQFEFSALHGNLLKAVLKDDTGIVCSTLERKLLRDLEHYTWSGLNDLPYGRYTLTLSQGADEVNVNLVKRV